MRLSQVAMSATDLRRTHAWYRDVVGLAPAGGTNTFAGPLFSWIQGLPWAAATCWWMIDGQDRFQLELFQFRRPAARPLPAERRPCDIGYTMVSFHVDDLDATVARADAAGTPTLTAPIGPAGARRACVRDPEGVLVELMEDDPRAAQRRVRPAHGPRAVARSVTLSVPDLDRSRRTFGVVLGLTPADDVALHGPEHEALWGLHGAERRCRLYWADDVLVELVQYLEPAGAPWPPGYRICDQGLLNVAFACESGRTLRSALDRCRPAGLRANSPVILLPGIGAVVYVKDADGFRIELTTLARRAERWMGFKARRTPRLAPFLRS